MTLRVVPLAANLRGRDLYRAIRTATQTVWRTQSMHLVHASIQSNHIHLLVEAADEHLLSRGMQGFQISAAKHINRVLRRKGRVFADRYYAHVLRTKRETRNAVTYVLQNWRKHGGGSIAPLDPCSTAESFPGWREARWLTAVVELEPLRVWPAASWLLRNVGELSAFDRPRAVDQGAYFATRPI
ncbi:MAG TPA: transposase [Kofleriaceae bacterium]